MSSSQNKAFKVYNSSAGSGKTFTLTKEYLKLILTAQQEGKFVPNYFKKILAITFTNDATNEMKQRIIQTLQDIIAQTPNDMQSRIMEETGLDQKTIIQRAKLAYKEIIFHYADFSISTIDAFFNKVISAFTQELDIPFNYELDLKTDIMLDKVVKEVIDKVATRSNEALTHYMIKYASDLIDDHKRWSTFQYNLKNFTKTLIQEKSYKVAQILEDVHLDDFTHLIDFLKEKLKAFEIKIKTYTDRFAGLMDNYGVEVEDFYYKSKGIYSYFRKNTLMPLEDIKVNSHAEKALEGRVFGQDGYNRLNQDEFNSVDTIIYEFQMLYDELSHYRRQYQPKMIAQKEILKHLYTLALINEIKIAFDEVNKKKNAIHISETNIRISQIVQNEPVPFVYEKLGERYKHILVDEFQDTSVMQWQNLLPLIQNNLSEGHFNMIVGDAKQAIYRWRGGDLQQLVDISQNLQCLINNEENELVQERYQSLQQHLDVHALQNNYRSTKTIIHFNNDFFEVLTGKVDKAVATYSDFQQQTIKQGTGLVSLNLIKDKDEYTQETLDKILTSVEACLKDGFELKDIAILCRHKSKGLLVGNFLKENDIEVFSRDSLLLSTNDKVNLVMSMLEVINQPDDILSKTEALYLFYKVVKETIPSIELNQKILEIVHAPIDRFFDHLKAEGCHLDYQKIYMMGTYQLAEELILALGIHHNEYRRDYVFRLLDWILEYTTLSSNHLSDLIEEWQSQKYSISITSSKDINAVTISTIHSAKGLEYPVVIIPFLDFSVSPHINDTTWVDLQDTKIDLTAAQKEQFPFALIRSGLNSNEPSLNTQLKEERAYQMLENLNLLYVAFTRPIYRLYTFSAYVKDEGSKVNSWIKAYMQLKGVADYPDRPDNMHYTLGKSSAKPTLRQGKRADLYQLTQICTSNTNADLPVKLVKKH